VDRKTRQSQHRRVEICENASLRSSLLHLTSPFPDTCRKDRHTVWTFDAQMI
jgi:hypothetical protein